MKRGTNDDRARDRFASVLVICLVMLAALGAVGIGTDRVAAQAQTSSEYVIVQGEECRPLEPLGNGSRSVEAFYDYRSPDTDPSGWYYAYGPARELLREDTSQVFLYRGSDGLSLVFLHDGVGSETTSGGTAEAEITGLPASGEWIIKDDEYAGQDDDEFESGPSAEAIWAWNEGNRTDGGAYDGLADDDWERITVEMAFNEASERYPYEKWNGEPEANEIERWIARSDGDVYALDMDEPVTIARGTCSAVATTADPSTATPATGPDTTDDPAGSEGNDSGGLPIDLPPVPNIPGAPNVPDAPAVPAIPEIPDVSDVPSDPAGSASDRATEEVADVSATTPLAIAVLVLALFAIALVTLRR